MLSFIKMKKVYVLSSFFLIITDLHSEKTFIVLYVLRWYDGVNGKICFYEYYFRRDLCQIFLL
jgi:hypothetical protein